MIYLLKVSCWVDLTEKQNNFFSFLEHVKRTVSSKLRRFERQTNEPSLNGETSLELEARTQLPNSTDLQSSSDFKSKNFPFINESLVQDIFSGKAIIPTFAEFLEYILSTDLQGKHTRGFNMTNFKMTTRYFELNWIELNWNEFIVFITMHNCAL